MNKILFGLIFTLSAQVIATPAQVIIIRHGEKPSSGNEVNQKGCERSFSLPKFFSENAIVNEFGRPVTIYAQQPKSNSSVRAIQTIAPTADALDLKVYDPYTRDQTDEIAHEILSNPLNSGKTVLVSWEHKVIADIAEALGVTLTKDDEKWPGDVFDQAWVIRFKDGVSLNIIPEYVIPGDNPRGGFKHWQDGPNDSATIPSLQAGVATKCSDNDQLNKLVGDVAEPPID